MAVQVFKDPYLFDFLGTDAPRREAELERGLMAHIQAFSLRSSTQDFTSLSPHLQQAHNVQNLYICFYFPPT